MTRLVDVHTKAQRSANMAAIRGKNTKPEVVVRRALHRRGDRYSLHGQNLPGRPDLVFRRRKRVIFVHGCFWHVHDCRFGQVAPATRAEFWRRKRAANVARDLRNQDELRSMGWSVLVVWECEIAKRGDGLLPRLIKFLDES